MSPGTHLLASWLVANLGPPRRGDLLAITAAGVLPDLDGLGYPVEWWTAGSAHPLTWFSDYHHVLGHGVVAGVLCIAIVALTRRSLRVCALAAVSFHLHLLCDLAGSGGPDHSIWPIIYGWPLSDHAWQVPWQWPLNSPINLLITLVLEISVVALAVVRGFSPVLLISSHWDQRVFAHLAAIRGRWRRRQSVQPAQPSGRED